MNDHEWFDQYEEFHYVDHSRQAHRQRRGKDPSGDARRYRRRKEKRMAEMSDSASFYVPTYAEALDPLHHERQWVINSTATFFMNHQIADVVRLVKAGKEANVYCCTGTPEGDFELLAAKLYRPRMLRHLKNNAVYKEGRELRDPDGKLIHGAREARAIANKTRFGQELDLSNWIGHEFGVQNGLYQAGADVPRPIAHAGNAILMEYIGDYALAAPMLQEVTLPEGDAQPLFARLMENVEMMLARHLVHGDLSAYNILYWAGRGWIIDFPQVVDARSNPNAFPLLVRDVQRLCDYFSGYGLDASGQSLASDLWERYMRAEL